LKYFFSISFLLGFSFNLFAQVGKFAPSAVRIGVEPGTIGAMLFSQKRSYFEMEADIDIYKYLLVFDYGRASYNLDERTYNYSNDGSYFRIGADYNFMNNNRNLNVAFVGLRYAASKFDDQLNYLTKTVIHPDTGWPATWQSSSNQNEKAHWYELTAGLKVRVVKQLFLGFTLRYKLFMSTEPSEELKPYYIPGFGKNISTSSFGFNYYVSYRIPFRKKMFYTDDKKVIEEKK
jgi:hypothetical protein